jgi:hypothetical protein
MSKKETITGQGTEITLFAREKEDYLSLTDMANIATAKIRHRLLAFGFVHTAQ